MPRLTNECLDVYKLMKPGSFFRFVLTMLIIWPAGVLAALDLQQAQTLPDIGNHSRYFFDQSGELAFAELPPTSSDTWKQVPGKAISFGYSSDTLWVQLDIENSAKNQDWIMEISYPILDRVDVYIENNEGIQSFELGDSKRFADRPVNHRNFVIPFALNTGADATITLRIDTGSSLQVPLKIWSQQDFLQNQQTSLLSFGTFFGFMSVMIVYNLMLYFFIREIRYVFYVIFSTSFVLFQVSLHGFGYQFIWSEFPVFNEHILPVSLGLTLLFESLFVSAFLKLQHEAPKSARFLHFIALVLAVLSLAAIVLPNRLAIQPVIAIGIALNISFVIFGLQRWRSGDRAARIFTIAWFLPILSALLVSMAAFGLIEHAVYTQNSLQLSMVFAVVLLSFALGESIAQERTERIQAHEEAARLSIEMEKERVINREVTALMEVVSEARDEAEKRRKDVSDLLNNSGQGFLSFGRDLIVEAEFSRACLDFFGIAPEGHQVTDLLYSPKDEGGRTFFAHAIQETLIEEDDFRRDMMLSLLPEQFEVGSHALQAEYRSLGGARILMVLTDLTKEIKLQQQVEQEHRRLTMIVSAITDQRDVTTTISSFRQFLNVVNKDKKPEHADLYRKVHTYKGLFNQFSFIHLPEALHQIESDLSQNEHAAIPVAMLWQAFDADMDVIVERLGANFDEAQGFVQVSGHSLKKLNVMVDEFLAKPEDTSRDKALQKIRDHLTLLGKVSLGQMFSSLLRGTYSLARDLKKRVDVTIHGEEILVIRKDYEDFVNSLIHVFRNAVDHGIESPEERLAKGKNEVGKITCHYKVRGNDLIITVVDDGAGVSLDGLKERLLAQHGLSEAEVEAMGEHQILQTVFDDAMSTRDEISEVSGRGIGLSATRTEVSKLGGHIEVRSQPEVSTEVEIHLPWNFESLAEDAAENDNTMHKLVRVLQHRASEYLEQDLAMSDVVVSPEKSKAKVLRDVTATLSLEGNYNAWVAFSFDRALLQVLTEQFLAQPNAELSDKDVAEMAGEFINIVVGLGIQDLNRDINEPILFSTPTLIKEPKPLGRKALTQTNSCELRTPFGCVDIITIAPMQHYDSKLNYLGIDT